MSAITLWSQLSVLLMGAAFAAEQITQLGRMNVNPDYVTLSGFSSGGSFAQQLFVSHSSKFSGLAVFSHTFYRCGPVTRTQRVYDEACTTLGNRRPDQMYDTRNAVADIENYFASGLIDNPRNMANKPLYVFAGTRNYLFTADMSLRILNVFEPFIRNSDLILTRVLDANLTLPSNRPDLPPCSGPPNVFAVSNCGFPGAFDSLRFLLGPNAVAPPRHVSLQPLLSFDQTEFFFGLEKGARYDMDAVGYLYVPTICKDNKASCLLHFYFHGCSVGRQLVGADHITNSGYLEVAEQNGIVMVFPQVVTSPENDIGCWDTYGFTSPLYATKRGPQVTVVKNMLARILGEETLRPTPVPHRLAPHYAAPHSLAPHSSAPHSLAPYFPAPHSGTPNYVAPHSVGPHFGAPHSRTPHSVGHLASPLPLQHQEGVSESPEYATYDESVAGFGIGGHSPPNGFALFRGDRFNSRSFLENNLNFQNLEARGTDTKCRVSRLQPNYVLQRCVANK